MNSIWQVQSLDGTGKILDRQPCVASYQRPFKCAMQETSDTAHVSSAGQVQGACHMFIPQKKIRMELPQLFDFYRKQGKDCSEFRLRVRAVSQVRQFDTVRITG